MNKVFISTAIFISLAYSAVGQITITSSSMPVAGDTLRYSNVNPASPNVIPTGANHFWNFDTLHPLSQGRYDYLSAFQTPYAFYFLNINDYGLKTADSIGAGTYKFYNVYTFYKKLTTAFQAIGLGFKYNNIPLAAYYTTPDDIYDLPMTYLRHDSTPFKFTVSLGTNIYYSQVGFRNNFVDGWGSIKTPYDSVSCLRLVSTLYETDSINFNGLGFSFPNPSKSYKWMSTAEHIPILEVSGTNVNSTFIPNLARYRDIYRSLAGIVKNEVVADIRFFPNPAQDFIVFRSESKQISLVELYDVMGKKVMRTDWKGGVGFFDLRGISSQTLVYKVIGNSGDILNSGKVLVVKP